MALLPMNSLESAVMNLLIRALALDTDLAHCKLFGPRARNLGGFLSSSRGGPKLTHRGDDLDLEETKLFENRMR